MRSWFALVEESLGVIEQSRFEAVEILKATVQLVELFLSIV